MRHEEAASAPPREIGLVGPISGGSRPAPQPTGEADPQGDRRHVAGWSVDLVRCSTAVRARASAKPVIDALGCAVRYERALYTAGGRELLELVRALPNDVDTVMVIGHNPSAGGVDGNVVRVVTPVSSGALGTIEFTIDHWAHVAPGSGTLTAHVTPAQSQADDELECGMSAAAILHRLTRHGAALDADDRELLVAFRPLDPSNRPVPFKRYAGREPVRLTRDLTLSSAPAASVLSGAPRGVGEGPWDEGRLAQLLFLSNGVSRVSRSVFGETTYFRTAMSAGNLHPIEIYVACGDLDGVPAGIHHFAPLEFGRTELRRGDFRDALAAAAADPRVAEAPVTLVVTGIPWRTAWKYGERGFRHLYWDAGTMLANLLALEPSASVRVGFADQPVSRLIGVDGVSEFPLVLVVLDGSETGGHREAEEKVGAVEPLDLAVEAMSRAPIEFPLATAAQRDGDLADATAVKQWRAAASSLGTPALVEVKPPTSASDDPIETVILRRGSTRLMRHETVGRELLTWGLGIAARAVPGDVASDNDATLLQHFVSVHDVEGVASGSYRLRGGRLEHGREGQPRDVAAHLCFDQPLGGDSAYTVFHAADLDEVLGALGSRGYRAAQLEAGIAAGRLALGAFALGYGATGLTFYDEAVSQHFGTPAACMLVTSVGVPDYRNAPGGPPGVPTQLARFDQLMERLSIQLRRGGL